MNWIKTLAKKVQHSMEFMPKGKKFINEAGGKNAYRYPSPASRQAPRIPDRRPDRMYQITHFDRDAVRNREGGVTMVPQPGAEGGFIESHQTRDISKLNINPGTGNVDVLRYDPSGVRTTMTANLPATEAIRRTFDEDHCPRPTWEKDVKAMQAKWAKTGQPPMPGKRWVGSMESWENPHGHEW